MCELFAMSSVERRDATALLEEFFSHGVTMKHGWGLAVLDGATPSIEKEPRQATVSDYLKSRLRSGVSARTLIAHVRLATVGLMDYLNCHPFDAVDDFGTHWTFAHNGTIFHFPGLNAFAREQKGQTDSERVMLRMISLINRRQWEIGRTLNFEERFDVLEKMVAEMSPRNKLNLLVYDGATLYIHSNFPGSLHWRREKGALFVSTRPLHGGTWEPVPQTALCAVSGGEILKTGTPHNHTYTPSPDDVIGVPDISSQL